MVSKLGKQSRFFILVLLLMEKSVHKEAEELPFVESSIGMNTFSLHWNFFSLYFQQDPMKKCQMVLWRQPLGQQVLKLLKGSQKSVVQSSLGWDKFISHPLFILLHFIPLKFLVWSISPLSKLQKRFHCSTLVTIQMILGLNYFFFRKLSQIYISYSDVYPFSGTLEWGTPLFQFWKVVFKGMGCSLSPLKRRGGKSWRIPSFFHMEG